MMSAILQRCLGAAILLAAATPGFAQTTAPTPTPSTAAAAAPAAKQPDSLVVYFDSGATAVRKQDEAVLDQASRLYRDGKPIVMVVTGSADAVGSADKNLQLSQVRANYVLRALVARGIPADRFQLTAKGETDPAVQTAKGVAEPRNRRVEISWR